MSALILEDIAELVTMVPAAGDPLGLCPHGRVVIVDGAVVYAGPGDGGPRSYQIEGPVAIHSAGGRVVSPGLCDPHAHLIWAGDRSLEFDLRNQGRGYAELQELGGGILSTVRATAAASDDELRRGVRERLGRMLAQGVTRCEAKTGYGLWPEGELRLLRLLIEAAAGHPLALSPTLLCHVPPPGLAPPERRDLVRALAALAGPARQAGAAALDVYCDHGAFTPAETRELLRAGRDAGLRLRCHAEQFTYTGAAALAAELGAVSVEHLEEIDDAGIAALRSAGTVANLLPGAALTLRLRWPDARRLIDAGVPVALGTDLNPGTSFTESLPLMMTLGCTQLGMSCAEAWQAVTVNAARALGAGGAGRLAAGSPGDMAVWEAGSHREVCQHFGVPLCQRVYVGGELRYERRSSLYLDP